jgi:hypothetical protein
MRLLLLGATGLVGRTALNQALANDAVSEVVAPTRRSLGPQNKLVNPVNLRLVRSLTIFRPSIIAGERSETRIAEGAVLSISRTLAPILPKKFHVNPAPVIAASLLDSVLQARPGCRWVFAEELD